MITGTESRLTEKHKLKTKKRKTEREERKQSAEEKQRERERHRLHGILILRISANLTGRPENRAGNAAGDTMKQQIRVRGHWERYTARQEKHTLTHMPAKDMSAE